MNANKTKKQEMTLYEIIQLANDYSGSRDKIADKVSKMNAEIEKIRNKHMHHIRNFAEQSNEKLSDLNEAIKNNPKAFTYKKLHEVKGLKFGYSSTQDKIVVKDESETIKLIKSHLGAKASALIKTEEHLIAKAVQNLPSDELKKIKVHIENGQPYVYVKPTDKEIDALIKSVS